MAKRGRKPKPQSVKDKQGNIGHKKKKEEQSKKEGEEQNTEVSYFGKNLPLKPSEFLGMSKAAEKIWINIRSNMSIKRYYEVLDEMAFSRYCTLFSWWLVVQEQLNSSQTFSNTTESVFVKMDRVPVLVKVAIDLNKQLKDHESNFCLNPVARQSLESDMMRAGNNPNSGQPGLFDTQAPTSEETDNETIDNAKEALGVLSPSAISNLKH